MNKKITVLIADDNSEFSATLAGYINAEEDLELVGMARDGVDAFDMIKNLEPDIVLLDVCTEGYSSGLVATENIKQNFKDIKVVVMSGFDVISYSPRAKEAGADAFVYKSKSMTFFIDTIRKVLNGEKYFPEPKTIPLPKGETPFTEREMQILRLICKHKSRGEIASELYISENTVKYHIGNLLSKTGCSSVAQLAIIMISSGYINPLY